MGTEKEEFSEAEFLEKREKFSELIRYTLPGYFLGLLAGIFLDLRDTSGVLSGNGLFGLLQEKERASSNEFFQYASGFEGLRGVWQKLMGGGSSSELPFPG